jgi:hypothetical protein
MLKYSVMKSGHQLAQVEMNGTAERQGMFKDTEGTLIAESVLVLIMVCVAKANEPTTN